MKVQDIYHLNEEQKTVIEKAREQIKNSTIIIKNVDTDKEYKAVTNFTELEVEMILTGGKINQIKSNV